MGAVRVASSATRVSSAITVAGTSAGAKGRGVGDGDGVGVGVGAVRVASSATRVNSATTVAGTSSVLPVVQPVISSAAAASSSASIQIAIRPFANKVIPPYPMLRQSYHAWRHRRHSAQRRPGSAIIGHIGDAPGRLSSVVQAGAGLGAGNDAAAVLRIGPDLPVSQWMTGSVKLPSNP